MGFSHTVEAGLHHFSDASEHAFGTASYLVLMNEQGRTTCSIVIRESRVAPFKQTTIQRLELTAVRCRSEGGQDAARRNARPTSAVCFLHQQHDEFSNTLKVRKLASRPVENRINSQLFPNLFNIAYRQDNDYILFTCILDFSHSSH